MALINNQKNGILNRLKFRLVQKKYESIIILNKFSAISCQMSFQIIKGEEYLKS